MKRTRHPGGLQATRLDEFWCSDCIDRSLFERIVGATAGEEWACTACGAAYFDAVDLVASPAGATVRGASVRSTA